MNFSSSENENSRIKLNCLIGLSGFESRRDNKATFSSTTELGNSVLQLHFVDFLGKPEAAQSLMVVGRVRAAAHNSESFRISRQTVFEEPRQLRFAKGYLIAAGLKLFNYIRQSTEALVD